MDAKEIVKALREHAEWAQANEWECPITLGDVLRKAADTIEELNDFQGSQCAKLLAQLSELRAENARLRAERDKAVEDLKANWLCMSCTKRVVGNEWSTCPYVAFVSGAEQVITCANHEWRGEEADGEKVQNG